ncbi:ATP-binding cassette domain-containing protein [Pseudolysinimonas sp.]|jgi:ABC-type multidrug transport system fused ATPase/permease subunit|uniref:ATP-binding cassette domain-containing protein n=1 Tax=Pseudolysinimonas sp. TaxID=2680009 RepID=UPI003783D74F
MSRSPAASGRSSLFTLLRGVPRSRVAAILVLGVAGGIAEAALLVLIVRVATLALSGRSSAGLSALEFLPDSLGGMIVIGLIAGVLTIAFQLGGLVVTTRAASRRMVSTRQLVLNRYFASSLTGQGTTSPGQLQEIFSQQILKGTEGLVLAGSTAAAFSNLAVLLVAAVLISPLAAVALVLLGGVLGIALIPLSRSVAAASRRMVAGALTLMGYVSVYVRVALEARVFGVAVPIERVAGQKIVEVSRAWSSTRVLQQSAPIIFRVSVLIIALVVIGSVSIWAPEAVAAVAVIALLLVRALSYLQAIQNNTQQMREMSAYWASARELIDSFPADDVAWGSTPLERIAEIEFERVGFSHDGVGRHLDDVTVTMSSGESVTVVGPSGGGKSTLLRVLLRLAEPGEGRLLVNGVPASDYRRDDWFSRVAYLPQEVRLIPGTVRDNVLFFREGTDDEVRAAIEMAALELDPRIFREGLDTEVTEEGRNLSGGQRQRIGLARCLLRRPDLLVLDEPTSALDPESERQIAATIAGLKSELITVLVTHRPAAAQGSDRVYAMDRGRLTARDVRPQTGAA